MTAPWKRIAFLRNLPENWPALFAPVPGARSSRRIRCLLCGRVGMEPPGLSWWKPGLIDFRGNVVERPRPYPWQLRCIWGHPVQCIVCRRPFVSTGALFHHQNCTLHHACCVDHTTVPEWKNPFALVGA